jgi:hypothetical protein
MLDIGVEVRRKVTAGKTKTYMDVFNNTVFWDVTPRGSYNN